jgi:hypothetical protein
MIYGLILVGGMATALGYGSTPAWRLVSYGLANAAAHCVTDYVTSRITRRLWAQKRVHDFFVVIGLDQAIHMATMVATLPILGLLP